MSPERTSKNGRYRSRWKRVGFGVIRVTYGKTLAEHAKAIALLNELWDNAQLEELRALQKKKGEPGRVTIRELLAAKKAGRHRRTDVLIDVRLQRPLWDVLEAMTDARPGGKTYHRRLRASREKFAKTAAAGALGPKAVVEDLRKLDVAGVRKSFISAADWNQFRKMIGVTLSQLLEDPRHPFRLEMMKRIPKETERHRDVDCTVEQFWTLVDAIPEHAQPGIVTLATTGMRLNTEYMRCREEDKRPNLPGIFCPGSKNADATGIIPIAASLYEWVDAGVPAPVKARWLRIYFHRAAIATGLGRTVEDPTTTKTKYVGIRLHDLRHLAVQLAMDGGASLNDVQNFARHADPAMTMRYAKRAGARRAADAIGRQLDRKPKEA